MKKIRIPAFILAVLLFQITAFASLNSTGPLTANNTSSFSNAAYKRVESLLAGNYAFADGETTAWINDSKVVMSNAAYISDGEMYIPSDIAESVFGFHSDNEFVSISQISEYTGMNCITDTVGIGIISSNEITAGYYTRVDALGSLGWDDVNENDGFDRNAYINKWRGLLTVPKNYDGTADDYYLNHIDTKVNSIYSKFNLDSEKGSIPFLDVDLNSILSENGQNNRIYDLNSSDFLSALNSCFDNLFRLAQYSCLKNDEALRNNVIEALDYLRANYYSQFINIWGYSNEARTEKGSWTYYQMTIPLVYSNILCLVSEGMEHEEILEHTNAIFDRSIDPTIRNGGASYEYLSNRLSRGLGYFNTAVLANDYYRMNYAMKYLAEVFVIIPEDSVLDYPSNVFYEDGSMLFHNNIAYSMGYGNSMLSTLSEMITLTENTPFSVKNVYGFEKIYTILENNFYPFVADNLKMHMVLGRGDVQTAGSFFKNALNIISTADDEMLLKRLINGLKQAFYGYNGNYYNFDGSTTTYDGEAISAAADGIEFIENINNLLDRDNEFEPTVFSKMFYNMDRAIYKSADYTAALAMSSERVGKYEAIGEKNRKGWYTGDGMLYVYTGDGKQYTEEYFANINPYKISGTTVDETVKKEAAGSGSYGSNLWAGGVSDGESAVSGYELGGDLASENQLKGRKSYFFLDGKIICIGSGITGGSGSVYTTVDNRLIDLE